MRTTKNELVAKFMGCTFHTKHPYSEETNYWQFNEYMPANCNSRVKTDELAFDTDWNWLMDAVEKITDLHPDNSKPFSIQDKQCSIHGFRGTLYKTFYGKTTRDAVYKAVVEFVKWYNEGIDKKPEEKK